MKKGDPEESQRHYSDEELKAFLVEDVQAHSDPLRHFDLVVKEYTGKLYSFAMSIIKQHENAEEAVQDAFVNAHKALKTYSPERILTLHLRAFLYRITKNAALKHLEKEKSRQHNETSVDALEPTTFAWPLQCYSDDVETQAVQHEKYEAFTRAFKILSKDEQIAFYMKIGLSLKYKEISTILNESRGTIKSRISRAREKLRKLLGNDYPEYFKRQDDEEGA